MTEATAAVFTTLLMYGFGAVAYGIKDNGFAYFLLLFYDRRSWPALAGTALLLPGLTPQRSGRRYWSDNTRSRWGRRHLHVCRRDPGIVFSLLWQPPDWSDGALFLILLRWPF